MSEPDGTPAAVSDEMVDATAPILRSLMRSHGAPIGTEAAECWVRDILAAVVPLIRAQVAAELSGWPFDVQVAEALRRLDRVGGVTPAEEEPTDVQAAFEAGETGETGQPTALVTVDRADLLTALNQRTGHSHTRPGVWDASNPPWRANKPCVECAARGRLRAALATALEQAQPLPVAAISDAEPAEPCGSDIGVTSPHRCVLPKGHGGDWHDDGSACWSTSLEPVESPVIDMGFLSLPAELQAEAERAVSEGQERSEEQK